MDYIRIWKEVILTPSNFYRRMPTTGGYADPLTFAIICLIVNTLLFALVRPTLLIMAGMQNLPSTLSMPSTVSLMIISGIISLFISALIINTLYKAFGGTGSYEGTFRFLCYSSAPIVFSWIPIVGLVIVIYELYLCIVGGMIVHNVSLKKSTLLFFPFALFSIYISIRTILQSFAH